MKSGTLEYQKLASRRYRERQKLKNPNWALEIHNKTLWHRFGVIRPIQTTCNICEKIISKSAVQLDHNHKTNNFRGWLCGGCNIKLAWLENRLPKIMGYLLR